MRRRAVAAALCGTALVLTGLVGESRADQDTDRWYEQAAETFMRLVLRQDATGLLAIMSLPFCAGPQALATTADVRAGIAQGRVTVDPEALTVRALSRKPASALTGFDNCRGRGQVEGDDWAVLVEIRDHATATAPGQRIGETTIIVDRVTGQIIGVAE